MVLIELMFDTYFGSRSKSGLVLVTKGHHTYVKHRDVAHVLWVILHVEYNNNGVIAILAHLGEPGYKVR